MGASFAAHMEVERAPQAPQEAARAAEADGQPRRENRQGADCVLLCGCHKWQSWLCLQV
jgi:hypothetical protein